MKVIHPDEVMGEDGVSLGGREGIVWDHTDRFRRVHEELRFSGGEEIFEIKRVGGEVLLLLWH